MTEEMKKRNAKNKALAQEIRQWLLDHEMWQDTSIYFNGWCYSTYDKKTGNHYYNDPKHLVCFRDDPSRYMEYYNKKTVTMSFEGPLYELLNYAGDFGPIGWKWEEEFNELFKKYGYYFELGNAWNLAAAEV